jgi:undecaprenyl-diphosphatase
MIETLIGIDRSLFLKINRDCQNDFLDAIALFFREPKFWIPLYLFMLVFVLLNFGRKAWVWIFYAALMVAVSDTISSKIFKPLFGRPRPCADDFFGSQVRLLASYCGGNGSFPSSHAANHFAMAMFFFLSLKHVAPKMTWLLFLWAACVCFSQVYVGVHYPSDVLGGAVLGILMGWFAGDLYTRKNGVLINPENKL